MVEGNPHSKNQLDLFSHFCTIYTQIKQNLNIYCDFQDRMKVTEFLYISTAQQALQKTKRLCQLRISNSFDFAHGSKN